MRSLLSVAHLPAWTEPAPSSASSKPDFTRLLPPKLQHCAMAGRGGAARTNGTAASNKICQFKLVLLGESAVGKSSLVLRFVKGQFHEYQESTIGGECVVFISRSVSALCCVFNAITAVRMGDSYQKCVWNLQFSSFASCFCTQCLFFFFLKYLCPCQHRETSRLLVEIFFCCWSMCMRSSRTSSWLLITRLSHEPPRLSHIAPIINGFCGRKLELLLLFFFFS